MNDIDFKKSRRGVSFREAGLLFLKTNKKEEMSDEMTKIGEVHAHLPIP